MENNKNINKRYWYGFVTGMVLSFLILGNLLFWGSKFWNAQKADIQIKTSTSKDDRAPIVDKGVKQKIETLVNAIDDYYLEDVDDETLVTGLYRGILESLGDPYANYYTAEELADIYEQTQGIYYGIGAYVGYDKKEEMCYISSIIPNTPAEESDLMVGDFIYKVDEEEVVGKESSEVVKLIKGKEHTFVNITVVRKEAPDFIEIEIERRKVETDTVTFEMKDENVGYILIKEFDDITYGQFVDALESLTKSGMKGLILDLRNNPGGNLSTVVDIAKHILPEGMIVYTEDKYGKKTDYKGDGSKEIHIPMVVLINGGSASASEILAAAIKDYGKGTLLGITTFGKGIVQRVISISDGSAIKVTISEYFSPLGNKIHNIGVEPDEELEWDYEQYKLDQSDNQITRAIELVNEQLGKTVETEDIE